SVSNLEFHHLVRFTSALLQAFALGPDHVRVGLLQVGTHAILEFDLDVHTDQESLQKSLGNLRQLQGDTNTEAALGVAHSVLVDSVRDVPKVLLWLTDGVQPGDVEGPMAALKAKGVYVLAIFAVHGNFQVLKRIVSPPVESHLYSVDIYNIEIITEDLREALIKIFSVKRLHLIHLTSHSALLQWCPVLTADSGYYELWLSGAGADSESRRYLSAESSSVELSALHPETSYTAFLQPQSNDRLFNTLSVHFTTMAGEKIQLKTYPAVVFVSDRSPRKVQVSWGPLQPSLIQGYTVEYGTIPRGQPETEYLITVTARHGNGEERAMSVRACTQAEPSPALVDLQLHPMDQGEIQVMWKAHEEGVRGYWLSWDSPKFKNQFLFVAPSVTSLLSLASLKEVASVCLLSIARGEGRLCCALGL
uniref:von Willebrand factor A domain-containing protein 1 n=1 Tax=Neogobius melanostomus TaxID=47308 RepID=A0A8C6WFW7_9GOBI